MYVLFMQGDSPETWRTDEFRMFQGGSIWKPPPLKRMKPPPLPELQEIVKKGQLSTRFVILLGIYFSVGLILF